ncbi:glycyl-radical enzyme activating protein [Candidatus Desulfosporosinus nitrosoreducens]|uniref:glycyl-radical enzyme activating protein n=1 Tax=Candidatus Desulfosporosinus nitrosoreducens TaxID=3401928 RepID=UPI00280C1C9B|nr:glycyl-radical enzyme activating protein [Desulfosporosinus sp. PR]
MTKGNIINIMKYSIHDGPGIRTAVFFKGCPLNCQWCHNPESQRYDQELFYWPDRCIGCGQCLANCPNGAIRTLSGKLEFRRDLCKVCGACCKVCHAGARSLVAKRMSVSEVMAEVEKDLIFYDESGGGVTFTGGEAMMQPAFLAELLKACRKKEIHTAVETCGFVKPEILQTISAEADLFLYDLKLMDSQKHQAYTGAANDLVLANLRWLAERQAEVLVRVPVIPGCNDDQENLHQLGEFLTSLPRVKELHLLPYHRAGVDKYKRLGREYLLPEVQAPENEQMERIKETLEEYGLKVKIGG